MMQTEDKQPGNPFDYLVARNNSSRLTATFRLTDSECRESLKLTLRPAEFNPAVS
jgi:hypothetical protein